MQGNHVVEINHPRQTRKFLPTLRKINPALIEPYNPDNQGKIHQPQYSLKRMPTDARTAKQGDADDGEKTGYQNNNNNNNNNKNECLVGTECSEFKGIKTW